MIQERHMKQAKRVDNGEIIIGYFIHGKYVKPCIMDEGYAFEVYPDTIEDVSVKPIIKIVQTGNTRFQQKEVRCPNCDMYFGRGERNYCENCGQRLDFE